MKLTVYLLAFASLLLGSSQAIAAPPNIVMVFIDDMGWGDFSCFGNQDAQPPNVDRLAAEGIRFSQFYVNAPICSPSRCALTTGQYPQRWKITSYLSNRADNKRRGVANWLDPKAPTLARSLQQNGYATGHFGKWHLGGQRDVDDAPPISDYGFDQSLTNFEGMLALARVPAPSNFSFDGEDLSATIVGQAVDSRSAPLFWRRPPDRKNALPAIPEPQPDLAVREGHWKLLCDYDGATPELYELAKDREESKNVAEQHPEVVKRLTTIVVAWHLSMPPDNGPSLGAEQLPARGNKKAKAKE